MLLACQRQRGGRGIEVDCRDEREVSLSRKRVLLAEDSTIVLEIEKSCFQDSEVSVFTAPRAGDVVNIARKVRPGLIYLAFGISSGGGEQCCRELKADPHLRTVPVVMVCASEEEKQRSRAAGCDDVIGRPIERREFLETGLSLCLPSEDNERMPCRTFVQCSRSTDTFFGTLEDVSMDGIFVGTTREVPAGELFVLKFLLPWSGATLIKTSGRVSWVNNWRGRRNSRLPPGFGVNFQGIDPQAADQICDYLELMRKRLRE